MVTKNLALIAFVFILASVFSQESDLISLTGAENSLDKLPLPSFGQEKAPHAKTGFLDDFECPFCMEEKWPNEEVMWLY